MKRLTRLDLALFVVLLGIWTAIALSRPDRTRRNFRWIPQMEDALTFESQREFLPIADKRLTGVSVRGTIARGYLPIPYPPTREGAARAGRELLSPLKPSQDLVASGGRIYAAYCLPCHGAAGLGDGPVTKRGVPAPPSLLGGKTMAVPDGRLFHIITYGQGNMPPYASQVDRDDRWKAILFVRSLQRSEKVKEKNP